MGKFNNITMKSIVFLYRKFLIENKKSLLMYFFIYGALTTIIFILNLRLILSVDSFYNSTYDAIVNAKMNIPYKLKNLIETVQMATFAFWSITTVVIGHWGIRHFNYSTQSSHYNILPITITQKWLWILSYLFIALPLINIFWLWIDIHFFYTPFLAVELKEFYPNSSNLFSMLFDFSGMDQEVLLIFKHFNLMAIIFILMAFQFNKLGFIKTISTGLVIGILLTLVINYLNYNSDFEFGDFGSKESQLNNSEIYATYFMFLQLFFLAGLFALWYRLKDKNY